MSEMIIDFGPKFDWFDVLDRLVEGEQPSEDQKAMLDAKAGAWPQCACGQLCKLLPRSRDMIPEDQELKELGGQFAVKISQKDWEGALEVMNKIERRSTKLLRKMGINVVLKPSKLKLKPFVHEKPLAARLVDTRLQFRESHRYGR